MVTPPAAPRIAYLVLAHAEPTHLGRLVGALRSPTSACFVHVDRKSDLGRFRHVEDLDAVLTPERVRVTWGDFTQVEAILVLLRAAVVDPRRFDRFVLVSGTDYPLRSVAGIERFFGEHVDDEFVNVVEIPDEATGKPISRMTTYQFRPRRGPVGSVVWRTMMAVGRRVHRRDPSAHLGGLTPHGGSTWWALTRPACEHVLAFVERERRIVGFFRHVVSPDESFVQTILANSDRRLLIRPNLTYTDWRAGGANPARLGEDHLDAIRAACDERDVLFARKFADADGALIERIDRTIRTGGVGTVAGA